MYVRLPFIPQALGIGVQARGVASRADGALWVAEMDALPEGGEEITAQQYEALVEQITVFNHGFTEITVTSGQARPFNWQVARLSRRVRALEGDD